MPESGSGIPKNGVAEARGPAPEASVLLRDGNVQHCIRSDGRRRRKRRPYQPSIAADAREHVEIEEVHAAENQQTMPILSLNSSIAAREVAMTSAVFNASETKPILIR